jgi:hypothetical protein
MSQAVQWQRFEGAILFATGIVLSWQWGGAAGSWWIALLIFFAPDISFAGYLFGPRVGAVCYNLVHTYAAGGALLMLGTVLSIPLLQGIGALWLAHSGFDRMLGYGLKLPEGFTFTHLGRIGRH